MLLVSKTSIDVKKKEEFYMVKFKTQNCTVFTYFQSQSYTLFKLSTSGSFLK